ncbi:polysaccharide deacetylase family protein [Amorphus sp. 3PC139-8]|uniref:polysaccharide deacetylase family protein n=1 Tax=Amorphus sp. 3PC139-8 TaxID=2735676 RepID=UPI00345D47CC
MIELKAHDRYDYVPLVDRADYTWPDGKRLALCICNNIEIFSFCDGLGSDSATVGAPQTSRNFAWRDYGNRVGQWYLFDLMEDLGLPASHNFNSLLFDHCPQIAERILERGDEFVGHGRTNAERQDVFGEDEERRMIAEATEAIRRFAGTPPKGWLGPYLAQTDVTLDLLKEAGYDYVLDWPADDQPFWMKTRSGPIMSVPYSIELNDSPSMVFRQEGARNFEAMIVDQFDEMLLQSRKRPLVFTIVLHSFVIGQPYRLRAFRRAMEHVLKRRDDLWITTLGGVAEYCKGQPIP